MQPQWIAEPDDWIKLLRAPCPRAPGSELMEKRARIHDQRTTLCVLFNNDITTSSCPSTFNALLIPFFRHDLIPRYHRTTA